ncbi:hypothetical protein [Flavobacterium selenitireducens]|uniref:hypothetical protein n=1 Tax=Flavobacterium selenitireducens TaxID=2722704 RepID=UPI00168AC198|nr:hypothetical protein [Flavobacterium selenitireducens]MBD3583386.1 hypothetical protein [Flavobacterium selenitireducens]
MKNVVMAALLLAGTIGFSQEKPETVKRQPKVELTAQQRNDLRVKELTLKLDLTASQQKQMATIIADQEKSRSEMKVKMKEKRDQKITPTADEVYAMRSKKLDAQIENRAKMKKLLNADQFAKWEKIHSKQERNARNGFYKRPKKTDGLQQQNPK